MGHWRACCKLNVLSHVQWLEIHFGIQPYLIDRRSQKLWLFRIYPSCLNGRVVSQEDAPVLTFESIWFLSSELILFLMISRIFFLSIVVQRLYLHLVVTQCRIWFMSSKLISNAIAKTFWYDDEVLMFYLA